MKKIGIITLSNSTNYGGVLQAYALSHVLREMGYDSINITYQKMPSSWKKMREYYILRTKLYGKKGIRTKIRILGGCLKTFLSNIHYFDRKKKHDAFTLFIDRYLKTTPLYSTVEEIKQNCSEYDGYITGSDQVWNNDFSCGEFEMPYFLTFVPEGKPCISYAASVGGKKPDVYVKNILGFIKHFKAISVREQTLCDQMKKLGQNNVVVMPDPVILVDGHEWETIEKKPDISIPRKYILLYCLELDLSKSSWLSQISKSLGLPIVDIMPSYKTKEDGYYCDYCAGPAQFIYYARHAEYVITNSFHLTLFSLIFGKKFLSLHRVGQEDRITNLLNKYNLSNHIVSENADWSVMKESVLPVCFDGERLLALNFLKIMEDLND